MEAENSWDFLLSFLIEKKLFKKEELHSENEIETIRSLYTSFLKRQLIQWLSSLKQGNKNSLSAASKSLKEEGNLLYKKGDFFALEAAQIYTQALYKSSKNSREIPLIHANRAAALMKAGFYQEAYDDCDCAIKCGYPEETVEKIYLRQAKCALNLADKSILEKSLKDIKEYVKQNPNKNIFQISIKNLETKLSEFPEPLTLEETIRSQKKQQVAFSPSKGRHVILKECAKENEDLISEDAFAFVPITTENSTNIDFHCQNCAKTNIIPFPCYNCSKVSYCSPKCCQIHEDLHSLECNGYKIDLWHTIGIAHLALRTLTAGFQHLKSFLKENCQNQTAEEVWNEILDWSENGTENYRGVLRLVTNFDKMNKEDYLRYSLTGCMLALYLKNFTNLFDSTENLQIMRDPSDWEILAAALITRHLGQMVCNAHSIVGLSFKKLLGVPCLEAKNKVNLGALHVLLQKEKNFAAIYPFISIYNHSCEPNIRNRFDKSTLTVRTIKALNDGDEIFNNYGLHYKLYSRNERVHTLFSQYCFKCDCSHCKNKTDDDYNRFHQYKCTNSNCKSKFTPPPNLINWFKDWENLQNMKMQCPQCQHSFNCDWYSHFINLLNACEQNQDFKNFNELFDIYNKSKCFLGENHVILQEMCFYILENFLHKLSVCGITSEKEVIILKSLTNVSIDYLNAVEQQTDYLGMEYLMVSTYLIDLIAIRRTFDKDDLKYDLEKLKKSFLVLSDEMREIFYSYWKFYIDK